MIMLLNGLRGLAIACLCLSCSASAVNTSAVSASVTTQTAGEGVQWMDWSMAYPKVASEKKILMVDLYTDWCYWCKVMDKETYAKPTVQKALANDFVSVKLNPETKNVTYQYEGKEYTGSMLAKVLSNDQIQGYPTTLFLTPNKKVYVYAGYIKEKEFIKLIDEVKQNSAKEE